MATLKYGSTGSEVANLQSLLNSTGNYSLETDGIFGSLTQKAVRDYQARNGLTIDGIVGTNTWGSLDSLQSANTGADTTESTSQTPDTATADLTMPTYTSQYGDKIQTMIDNILNRQEFSYDVSTDPLYQQYSDMYQRQGKLAMQDAMGQAAALTGGYGNSYAQAVGQQAYQGSLNDMNAMIPELRDAAYGMYANEGTNMQNSLSVLQNAEDQAYSRYRDDVGDYESARNYAYQQEQDAVAQQQWEQEYNLAVAQAAKSSSGGGGSSKSSSYSLLDDLQSRIDSGTMTEDQATSVMNQYYGIEESKASSAAANKLSLSVEDDWEKIFK